MTLSEKQRLFTRLVGKLIEFSYEAGYELTFSEAYRTPEQAALNAKKGSGIANSLHTQRLAVYLNLFRLLHLLLLLKRGHFVSQKASPCHSASWPVRRI